MSRSPDRETAATFGYYQQSVDADPEAEWYVNQTIEVTERADTSAVGWYVGWALAPTLGYDTRLETLRSEREFDLLPRLQSRESHHGISGRVRP